MKKIISLLVSVILIIGIFPSGVSFAADSSLENGIYYITQGNKYVNVYTNYVSDIKNNTKINMWGSTKHATQQFTLEKQTDGSYKILTQKAKFTLNISSLKSGASVICYADTKKNTEYFIIDAVEKGYTIKPKNADSLAVTVNGSDLVLKKYTGSTSQVFKFINTSDPVEKLSQTAETVKSIIDKGEIQSPIKSRVVSSPFQPYYRHDYSKDEWAHIGVDYVSSESKRVYAIYDGEVKRVGFDDGVGNYLEIKHKYNGKTFYSLCLHLNSVRVKEGDKVEKGQYVAVYGSTGEYTTGPHLHIQISSKSSVTVKSKNNITVHTPKNQPSKKKAWSEKKQSELETFDTNRMTFYNPEVLIKKGLAEIMK